MKKLTAIFGVFVLCAVHCTGFAFGDSVFDKIVGIFGKYCNDNNMSIDCELLDGTDFRNAFACKFKENIDENQLLADLRKYCNEKFTKSNDPQKSSTTAPTSGTQQKNGCTLKFKVEKKSGVPYIGCKVTKGIPAQTVCTTGTSGFCEYTETKNLNGRFTVTCGKDKQETELQNFICTSNNPGVTHTYNVSFATDGDGTQGGANTAAPGKPEKKDQPVSDAEKKAKQIRDAYFDDINKIHRAYNNKLRQLQKNKE